MIFEAPETFVFKTWIAQHLGMCQEFRVLSKEHENRSKCLGQCRVSLKLVKMLDIAVVSLFKKQYLAVIMSDNYEKTIKVLQSHQNMCPM